MKPFITTIVLYAIIELSYAGIDVGYKGDDYCKSYDCLHEIEKIPKFDSVKHSVVAKYCLHYNKDIRIDSTLSLLLYEQVIPLTVKMQKKCRTHSIDGEIYLEPIKIFFGGLSGEYYFCHAYDIYDSKKNVECGTDMNEHYDIYRYIKSFGVDDYFEKTDKISYLFNRYIPLKWNLKIFCNDEEISIPVPEDYYIYISEICTEEQLKKIEGKKLSVD
ncbi:MAG: hypothetical protein FWC26_02190 [Fibromonadales bacterium]|nr:hypothetical protein [Fibromonadales bacterium]